MDSNEDDEYLSDPKNLMLLVVGMVWQRLNRDIFKLNYRMQTDTIK